MESKQSWNDIQCARCWPCFFHPTLLMESADQQGSLWPLTIQVTNIPTETLNEIQNTNLVIKDCWKIIDFLMSSS